MIKKKFTTTLEVDMVLKLKRMALELGCDANELLSALILYHCDLNNVDKLKDQIDVYRLYVLKMI